MDARDRPDDRRDTQTISLTTVEGIMGIQHASMQVTTIENQLMQLMLMHDASHLLPHRSHCGAMMLIPHNGRTHPLWPLIGDPMSSTYQC